MSMAEARYHPNVEQFELANVIEGSLRELLPVSRLHRSFNEDAATWKSLEEIGVLAIGMSEEDGGCGLGAVEEALIVMGLGRQLASAGVLATIGANHLPCRHVTQEVQVRRAAAAYRDRGRVILVDEPGASVVLLRGESDASLHRMPADSPGRVIEDRLWLATLREAAEPDEALARCDPLRLCRLRLIDAAALAGAAIATSEMAVAYAGERQQFGRPIGSFQAIKHHCADMAIRAWCARDQVAFAAVAVDDGREDALAQVESAFLFAGSAAVENAGKNIQIHGGLGFSDEAVPHLYLKRVHLLLSIAGGLEAAVRRVAATDGAE